MGKSALFHSEKESPDLTKGPYDQGFLFDINFTWINNKGNICLWI